LRGVTLIAATSPAYARTSPTLTRADVRGRVRIAPLGVEEDSLPLAADQSEVLRRYGVHQPFILFIGAMRYYKGITFLLEAARISDVPLVMVGGGSELSAMRQLAAEMGLSQVVFTGHVPETDKIALLRACRAVALPSHLRSEAYGMALVEAALCAKPMISCEIGTGTSYINVDGVTGHVVPPRDPAALARAMRELAEDGALAIRLGKAARARYDELFCGPATGRAHQTLYSEALSAGKKPAATKTIRR
jgi:glycosyltransferase involved in cell wall biosynthesis